MKWHPLDKVYHLTVMILSYDNDKHIAQRVCWTRYVATNTKQHAGIINAEDTRSRERKRRIYGQDVLDGVYTGMRRRGQN